MPREDGYKNLKHFTGSNAAIQGSKGGIRSGEVRRERRTMRDALEYMLEQASNNTVLGTNNMEEILIAMIMKAQAGNVKAAEFVRDTVGDKIGNEDKEKVSGQIIVQWQDASKVENDTEETGQTVTEMKNMQEVANA